MTSKTRMIALIKAFDRNAIDAALKENPDLLEFRDERGRNWLHLCAAVPVIGRPASSGRDSVKVAELLIRHGLEPDGAAFTEGEWKATPLWCAIGRGRNLELARFLLRQGADPNHALWSAVFSRNVPALKLLIEHGADVDLGEEWSPFVYCARWGHYDVARELLKLGADINSQGKKKMTALHYMLRNGSDVKEIRWILQQGARHDLPDASGATAAELMRRKRDPQLRKLADGLP